MSEGPRILITNDDGIDAPGIEIMIGIARQLTDDFVVVAPARNQSGVGHRFSFGTEMSLDRRARNIFALDGSPADCVAIGYTHVMADHPPDIVLSGVNDGQNLGDVINCSGTMAGAREGAMQGALGIAMSQALDYEHGHEVEWDVAKTHGAAVARALWEKARAPGTYYNVNFPLGTPEDVSGVRIVPHQRFSRSPMAYYPSVNAGKFFVAIPETPQPLHPEHDFHVLHHDGAITITPLRLEQTDHATIARLGEGLAHILDPDA